MREQVRPELADSAIELNFVACTNRRSNIPGANIEGEPHVIGHHSHSLLVGALFVPQSRSTPKSPHKQVSIPSGRHFSACVSLSVSRDGPTVRLLRELNGMNKAIALLGEYNPAFPPHAATTAAIQHSLKLLNVAISADWISTADIEPSLFARYSAIWVAPGSPYTSMEKTLWAIRYARENNIPCLGTCGGFQHIVLEYARNVLDVEDAQHAEYDPYASTLFISRLACSLAGREMQLNFVPRSRIAGIYGGLSATENYYCNFGVNPDYVHVLRRGPLNISGADLEGEARVIEHPGHPFFIGTLFVPQSRSTPKLPHPIITAFLQAVADMQPNAAPDWTDARIRPTGLLGH